MPGKVPKCQRRSPGFSSRRRAPSSAWRKLKSNPRRRHPTGAGGRKRSAIHCRSTDLRDNTSPIAERLGLRFWIRVTLAVANDTERAQTIRVSNLPIDFALARDLAQRVEQTLDLIGAGPFRKSTACLFGRLG